MVVAWVDLAIAAYEAGFRGEDHAIAIALAHAESSRVSDATNWTDPNGGSFGLMQINGVHDPDATGTYPNMVPTQAWIERMYIPSENYKAAFKVFKDSGNSFKPWSTYTQNLHKAKIMSPYDVAKAAMDGRARMASLQTKVDTLTAQRNSLSAEKAALQAEVDRLKNNISAAIWNLQQ